MEEDKKGKIVNLGCKIKIHGDKQAEQLEIVIKYVNKG